MSRAPRRLAALVAVVATLGLTAGVGGLGLPAAAAASRVSYTQMLNEFMCVACHESLAVAQSPESFSERQYLRILIAQGDDRSQIKQAMVANYGEAVLAEPPAHGFNLLVYVIPPLLLVIGLATVLVTIPRWRRRTRLAPHAPAAPALGADDARRLDEDLERLA